MGNLGWFILLYIVVGWIIDLVIMLGMKVYFGVKDRKKDDKSFWLVENGLNEAIEENFPPVDDPKKFMFKSFIIGRLFWPITIPIGIIHLWPHIKESRRK